MERPSQCGLVRRSSIAGLREAAADAAPRGPIPSFGASAAPV